MSQISPEIFVGECNEHVAHVYASYPRERRIGDLSLVGKVRGPKNVHGYTLATNYPFVDLGPGSSTLLRAIVTDPCTWSPDTPTLYEYHIEDQLGEFSPVSCQEFGIRRFGVRGKSFFLDGRRWVPRAVYADEITEPLETWRFRSTVLVSRKMDRPLFAEASRIGVMVAVDASDMTHEDVEELLHEVSSFAAVAIVLLPPSADIPERSSARRTNIVLAQRMTQSQMLQSWADAAWLDATDVAMFKSQVSALTLPVIAERRYGGADLAEARAACDQLQADLAPVGQFAGYVV